MQTINKNLFYKVGYLPLVRLAFHMTKFITFTKNGGLLFYTTIEIYSNIYLNFRS